MINIKRWKYTTRFLKLIIEIPDVYSVIRRVFSHLCGVLLLCQPNRGIVEECWATCWCVCVLCSRVNSLLIARCCYMCSIFSSCLLILHQSCSSVFCYFVFTYFFFYFGFAIYFSASYLFLLLSCICSLLASVVLPYFYLCVNFLSIPLKASLNEKSYIRT